MSDNKRPSEHDLGELLLRLFDGNITKEEFEILQDHIINTPKVRDYYYEFLTTYVGFSSYGNSGISIFKPEDTAEEYSDLLSRLAEEEIKSPGVTFSKTTGECEKEIVVQPEYPPVNRKISRTSIVSISAAAAAVIFFVLFAHFVPVSTRVEVATLKDSIGAKWANVDIPMRNGSRIFTDKTSLLLQEGWAELQFDTHVRVVVEAPAEFQILAENQLWLRYGKVYAAVPHHAIGFTVNTPSAQIVDLGTEFGVDCSLHSDTSLYVINGKTVLIAGDKSNKVRVEVNHGQAKEVLAATHSVSDIPCNDRLFVRDIDSASNLIWRGQTELNLADIVAGGNGFGKVRSLIGLNPSTGQYSPVNRQRRSSKNNYSLVPDSKFIDGVFVPDGGLEGRIVITSLNDTFPCPDTRGEFTLGITVYTGDIKIQTESISPAIFDGHRYDNNQILMLHSNVGITFDLEAIRQSLPGLDLTHFKAFGGLTEALRNSKTGLPDIDFWVVVDGQTRYERKALKIEDGKIDLDIELHSEDRFMTLIVTDGLRATEPQREYAAWDNDFFYLIDPTLEIEASSD